MTWTCPVFVTRLVTGKGEAYPFDTGRVRHITWTHHSHSRKRPTRLVRG